MGKAQLAEHAIRPKLLKGMNNFGVPLADSCVPSSLKNGEVP